MIARSHSLPVSAGAVASTSLDAGSLRVTRASFSPDTYIAPHVHDRTCVAIMRRGSFALRFPGARQLDCTPGTLVVEPVGDTHCNCVGGAGAEVIVIQPAPEVMSESATLRRFLDGVREVRAPQLAALAQRLERELAQRDDLTHIVVEAIATELLAVAARAGNESRADAGAWLVRAEEILRACFRRGVRLSVLAAECGVSAGHLARAFRARHRCSVGDYQRRLRVAWAADRIRAGSTPLSVIALEAGFSDQSHLTRWFRAVHGVTPAEWRHPRPS